MKNRLVLLYILILVASLISVTFSYNTVFASHDGSNPPEENIRTEPFRYYIIYVAMERDCNKYDNQILSFFRALVPAYLHKYGFYLITEKAECINAKGHFVDGEDPTQYGLAELAKAVKRGEEWGRDLTVIVFDNKAGYLYSKATNAGGHYYWKNYEHIVTTSTFGYKGESDWNALVLSEEVSHFVLRYFGYPEEIWGGQDTSYVHANRIKYRECEANHDLYSTECSKTWTTIEGGTLRSDGTGYYVATFRVLAPYDKPISESCPSGYTYNSNDRSCYLDKPTPPSNKYDLDDTAKYNQEAWRLFQNAESVRDDLNYAYRLSYESISAKNLLQSAKSEISNLDSSMRLTRSSLDVADKNLINGNYDVAVQLYKTIASELKSKVNDQINSVLALLQKAQITEENFQSQKTKEQSIIIPQPTQKVQITAKQILAGLDRSAIYEPELYSLSKITLRIKKIENGLANLDVKLEQLHSQMMEQQKYTQNQDSKKHFGKAQDVFDQLEKNLISASDLGSLIVRTYNSAIEKNDAEFADSITYRQLLLNLDSLEQKIENIDSLAKFIKQELDSAKGIVEGYYRLQIPTWIKNNVQWWSEGNIDDEDFLASLEFMIKNKIINIPDLPKQSHQTSQEKIPLWVKNNAKWWSDGIISEEEFVQSLQYLISIGIIKVDA